MTNEPITPQPKPAKPVLPQGCIEFDGHVFAITNLSDLFAIAFAKRAMTEPLSLEAQLSQAIDLQIRCAPICPCGGKNFYYPAGRPIPVQGKIALPNSQPIADQVIQSFMARKRSGPTQ